MTAGLGHEAVNATCTTAGSIEYWQCSNCDKYYSDANAENQITDLSTLTIAATGHNMTEHAAVNPTCTTAGSKAYYSCSSCSKNFSDANGEHEIANLEEYLPVVALGHDLIEDAAVSATCTTAGKTLGHHCSRCDYTDGGEVVEALGHNYEWVTDKAATYTETGLKHEECTRCHDKKNENTVIEVISHEHTLTPTAAVAPTCTVAGSKAYYTCSICSKHFSDAEGQLEIENLETYLPVAALGHDLVVDPAVAATCTTPGKEAGHHCSRCDYTDGGATIDALGHNLVEDAAVAATCR